MQHTVRGVLGVVVASLLSAGLLAACSSSDGSEGTTAAPAPAPAPATSSAVPTPEPATSEAPSTEAPSTQAPSSAAPSASPTPSAKAPGSDRAVRSARSDVATIAPQLESYYRDREYPEDLTQVQQTLADSGVTLSPGNTIGGYDYDGDAVEFTLCVENTSGAWATYNTAPMTLQDSGRSGGCP